MKKTTTPGEAFRDEILEAFDLDGPQAEQLLDAIASTIDELAMLEQSVRDEGVLLEGSRGQKVAHPGLAAIAKHRALLSRLVREMFPEDDAETQSQKAARAARARWRRNKR